MGDIPSALSRVKLCLRRPALRLDVELVGEVVGTFILVFFGLGAVHVAVLANGLVGIGQVAAVWGIAVGVAIYTTAELSGAHLNPAITLALAVYRGFPWRNVGKYVLAQVFGAFLAAACLFSLFAGLIGHFEQERGITRGASGSEQSAMLYGEYFPNPAMVGHTAEAFASLTVLQAMIAEAVGTAMLAFVVFAASYSRGGRTPTKGTVAIMVGLGLAMIISVIAPLTQAGFNPARDFGPRLFSYLVGWGSVAIPGPRGGFFTVFILGPVIGALVGGGLHRTLGALVAKGSLAQPDDIQPVVSAKRILERKRMGTQLIFVGGFLGAGKTTLLERAAQILRSQGQRVGVVTNDQAANLVDTLLLQNSQTAAVQEVAGGCFCCHFPDLVGALEKLTTHQTPDVILCEPVGSCTDVSATVLQPLKKLHRGQYILAPFTVLLDPQRTVEAFEGKPQATLPEQVLYIFRKQIEEADLLVLNKEDKTPLEVIERCRDLLGNLAPNTPVLTISALTGAGVEDWLGELGGQILPGQRIAEIDYDLYASGEAALGWLNARLRLTASSPVDWHELVRFLLVVLQEQLCSQRAEIAHVKLRLTSEGDSLTANLTANSGKPSIGGRIGSETRAAELVFNARVHIAPDRLQAIFQDSLSKAVTQHRVETTTDEIHSFAPARPEPTHRIAHVVS